MSRKTHPHEIAAPHCTTVRCGVQEPSSAAPGRFRDREPSSAHPGCLFGLNLEDAMTDYRDPNYRDPTRPGGYRDPLVSANPNHWSTATWGWIAGISVV